MLIRFQSLVSFIILMTLVFSFIVVGEKNVQADAVRTQVQSPAIERDDQELTRTDYGKMPLLFEQNKGQTDKAVKFVSRGPGYTLYLTKTGTVFSLKVPTLESETIGGKLADREAAAKKRSQSDTLEMRFAGANPNPNVIGREEVTTKTHYYIGKKKFENLSNYRRVNYEALYDGIDAVFYGNDRNQLEYDFKVSPNADPGRIGLEFAGAENISVDEDGRLIVKTSDAQLVQEKPFAYQEIDGERKEVAVSYFIENQNVHFSVGEYDRSKSLTIDPAVKYLTYVGGTAFDIAFEIAADSQGNAYIVGTTNSLEFPFARNDNDGTGIYVAKIDPNGTEFLYITLLEGTGDDTGIGIAVDGGNNAYVTGIASHNFPTSAGAYDTVHGVLNNDDAFVTKLDSLGNISYSTFLGGTDEDNGFDIAVDASGKAYVVGSTYSNTAFPKKNQFQGCGFFFPQSLNSLDAFLTVFNAAGNDITYSTCIGGSVTTDQANGVGLDSSNNVYMTGFANGGNFPTKNADQPESGGGTDGWIAKFNPNSSGDASLIYSTYVGGSGTDNPQNIAVASNGVASITGVTGSFNFPLQNAFDSTNQINEAFVTQYNSSGVMLNSTFLGGADQDQGNAIAVGNGGTLYVSGFTLSNDFPMATPFQATRRGLRDAFVAKIRFGGSNPGVSSSSYLGGNGNDKANGIAVRGNLIYLSGQTDSNNLLTTAGVIKATSAANATNPDGFVAKILDSRKDTIGTFDPVNTIFGLRNTLSSGPADITVDRGIVGDVPVAGDFNGDGIDTVSTFNSGTWKIQNVNVVSGYSTGPLTVNFGQAGDLPIVGDWNNDGIDTVGVYRPSAGQFFLTNSPATTVNPPVNVTATFGVAEDLPVSGDWDADGVDSVGVFRPSVGQFFLTNANIAFPTLDVVAFFGTNGDLPVAGDFDGNGVDTIGVWRTSTQEFFLSNDNILIANQFVFGAGGDRPVVGDWDGKPNQ